MLVRIIALGRGEAFLVTVFVDTFIITVFIIWIVSVVVTITVNVL